jgi:hypothetical protein
VNTYTRGTPVNLVERFVAVDPITEEGTLADPTTVVFTILSPDNVEQTFQYGVDSNVIKHDVGIYVCSLGAELPTGTYAYRCDGGGALVATSEGAFDVIPSGVLDPDAPTVAQPGPCSSWIEGSDVLANGPPIQGIDADSAWKLDTVAYVASDVLYSLSGRQFPGVCQRTVRPTREKCGCFGIASGIGWWSWTPSWGFGGWGWANECGDRVGCGAISSVPLAGYPVRAITEVKIGGDVLAELDDDGNPNYRLDGRRRLVRMDDPASGEPRLWPACQNMSLDDTQAGTFSITYTWGADVPALGRLAAAQMARELWVSLNGGTCKLPSKATKVVRAGITIERVTAIADALRAGSTGIPLVDTFIATYNPNKRKMRSAVWSPDVTRFARKVGQG